MKGFAVGLVIFMLVVGSGIAQANHFINSFDVTAPGPLNSGNIQVIIMDNDTFSIGRITFDTSGTHSIGDGTPLVIDPAGPFNIVNNTGGTASFFGSGTSWGFNFSSFDTGEDFSFNWDPDIASNPNYGAVISELVGTVVTIDVVGNGQVSGTMQIVGDTGNPFVGVNIPSPAEVPEPTTMLLIGSGLFGLWGARKKFRK